MSTQETKSILFTVEEANILLQLLDLSVKNVGISDGGKTAQNATYFFTKITNGFAPKEEPAKDTNETKPLKKSK